MPLTGHFPNGVQSPSLTVSSGDITISGPSDVVITGTETVAVNGPIRFNDTDIRMANLPVLDPAVAGQLWNDSGTIKVSTGA